MKSKLKLFADGVFAIIITLLALLVVVEIVNDIITQTKIRNKIQDPTKCIMINKKYYCEVEK